MADERNSGAEMSDYLEFVNRRGFLKGAAMAGVASFLAACAGSAPATNQAAATAAAPRSASRSKRP